MPQTSSQYCPVCSKPNLCNAANRAADCWCTKIEVSAQNKVDMAKKYDRTRCLCVHCLKKQCAVDASK